MTSLVSNAMVNLDVETDVETEIEPWVSSPYHFKPYADYTAYSDNRYVIWV